MNRWAGGWVDGGGVDGQMDEWAGTEWVEIFPGRQMTREACEVE